MENVVSVAHQELLQSFLLVVLTAGSTSLAVLRQHGLPQEQFLPAG